MIGFPVLEHMVAGNSQKNQSQTEISCHEKKIPVIKLMLKRKIYVTITTIREQEQYSGKTCL